MNTSRSILGFGSLLLIGMLSACSDDPEGQGGSSSGAAGSSSGAAGSSGNNGSGTGFRANETWDVVAGDRSGAITIAESRVDLRIGEFTAVIALTGTDGLTMSWTESGETTQYTGTRKAGAKPFELGVTKAALEGEWTLAAGTQAYSASVTPDHVKLGCVGSCTQGSDPEGIDVVRAASGTGALGNANGEWAVTTQPTETKASVRITGNSIVIDDEDVRFSATWVDGRMSGTVTADQVEFSAQKR